MKIYKDLEQGTKEWFDVRAGKMTASHAQAIGNYGKGLDTYINNLMADKYASAKEEQYTNGDLERGKELEALARGIYEMETGHKVEQVGFIEYDEFTGCSPDGLVNDDGGTEIKCLKNEVYFKVLVNGIESVVSDYNWQIQMCLYLTGRKWWDLILYNPNYKKPMLVHRIYPDADKFKSLQVGLSIGVEKIKLIQNKLKNL